MSEPVVIVAIIGAVVSILLPIIAILGAVINAKLNAAAKHLETIHQLTNSNLTAANTRLDKALEQIKVLQELVAAIKSVAQTPEMKIKVLEQEIDAKKT